MQGTVDSLEGDVERLSDLKQRVKKILFLVDFDLFRKMITHNSLVFP